jgi:hypothetical protein
VGLTNASVLTNDGRAVLSFDPDNPSIAPTVTVDGNTYTQGVDGLFAGSDGSIWSGETPGSGMTASAGSQLRSQMGNIINNNDVSDATIEEWGANVNGANTKLNDGGDTEGGKDKGSSTVFGDATNAGPKIKKRTYDNLRYPDAQLSDDADYMQILMLEYVPGKFKRGNRASERQMKTLGSVILPIPPGLADNNQVSWNQHSMNALQMEGAAAAVDIMNSKEFADAGDKASELLEKAKNSAGELGTAAKLMLTGNIPGINASTNQLLARNQGQIINPNMELLFNGPAIRSFSYTFRLTARNEKETGVIRKIIRFFKQGMSVKRSSGESIYLDSPNIFQPSFHAGSKEHPFLYKMKRTALTGFGVNYVPDGTYMTLPNSSMTAYEIRLDMQELDPIFDEDYENDNDATIGF